MAKTQVVSYSYTCDVCGSGIADTDADGATRKISWEGSDYVLDVCATHSSELSDALGQLKGFVDVAHRDGARRGRRPASASATATATRSSRPRGGAAATAASGGAKRGDLAGIRSWAQANGLRVGDRGRIQASVIAAYDAAQNGSTTESSNGSSNGSAKAAPAKRRPRKAKATTAV
jgi:hypothetical protein